MHDARRSFRSSRGLSTKRSASRKMAAFDKICSVVPKTRKGHADIRLRMARILDWVAQHGQITPGEAWEINRGSYDTVCSDLGILAGAKGTERLLEKVEGNSTAVKASATFLPIAGMFR